ncbi:Peroxidase [Thalictrum thalictroides]|uniref:peroxidase n=1 Tax=Thalictrum thalictroides TaxID=46969 RepID=A0A7J6UW73_THATH|nr:Peroxidase [Thalictrum thalictroides]
MVDLVALSGAHTIGLVKCNFVTARLYNNSAPSFAPPFATVLKQRCPPISDNKVSLDFTTPLTLDNVYYQNVLASKGLLVSDQSLLNSTASKDLVEKFAMDNSLFLQQFTKSMIKLGNIAPAIGSTGEVRTNCRKIN